MLVIPKFYVSLKSDLSVFFTELPAWCDAYIIKRNCRSDGVPFKASFKLKATALLDNRL